MKEPVYSEEDAIEALNNAYERAEDVGNPGDVYAELTDDDPCEDTVLRRLTSTHDDRQRELALKKAGINWEY